MSFEGSAGEGGKKVNIERGGMKERLRGSSSRRRVGDDVKLEVTGEEC